MAVKDRELLALIETAADPEQQQELLAAVTSAFASPDALADARHAYALLDSLVDAPPDDPRIAEAARTLAGLIPPALLPTTGIDPEHSFLRAFYADFAPAQAAAIRQALHIVQGQRP
jgi:hypothetical protein